MKPKKGGIAEKKGIKFTGNPDARDSCEKKCECAVPFPRYDRDVKIIFCRNCNGQIS